MTHTIMPDRKKMPTLKQVSQLKLDEPGNVMFNNNMDAYIIKAGQEPITRIDIIFKAGAAYQKKRLIAGSVNNLLKEGTSTKSSAQIAGILDYYGAYLNTQYSKDTASITLLSLTKHLDNLLPLLGELLTESVFPQKELDIYLNRQKQRFLVNYEKVRYRTSLEFNKLVFGLNSAYGQVLSLDDFNKVTHEDIIDFYKNFYCPENAYVVISGNVNDKIIDKANRFLGMINCKGKMPDLSSIVFASKIKNAEKIIEKKDALQSAIRVGKQIINRTHPDYPAVTLLNTVLGGYFGSRLMSNLREDKGYTYGAYSFIQTYKNAAMFSIATEVNADFTNSAMSEICKEMDRLRNNIIPDDELELVKNYISGNFLKSFDGPLALSERFILAKDFDLTFDHYKTVLEKILKLTSKELIDIANKYFNSTEMIKLIVGKTS
jgi:predicted Zn-dependent peptidase